MGAVRFPVPCPTCGYLASGRLRSEEYGPQHDTFLRLGSQDLERECPDHTSTAWKFMDTNAWKAVEHEVDA